MAPLLLLSTLYPNVTKDARKTGGRAACSHPAAGFPRSRQPCPPLPSGENEPLTPNPSPPLRGRGETEGFLKRLRCPAPAGLEFTDPVSRSIVFPSWFAEQR